MSFLFPVPPATGVPTREDESPVGSVYGSLFCLSRGTGVGDQDVLEVKVHPFGVGRGLQVVVDSVEKGKDVLTWREETRPRE